MILRINKSTVIVFDLDDTLYKEYFFALSAFGEIVNQYFQKNDSILREMMLNLINGRNVFEELMKKYGPKSLNLEIFLELYRKHFPRISLDNETKRFLFEIKELGLPTGIITEGRSITQRNKIKALGLDDYFDVVVITEELGTKSKDNYKNYIEIQNQFPGYEYVYIADNPVKDFIIPNRLNWITVMLLDNGQNIHKQELQLIPSIKHPGYRIESFNNLIISMIN